MNVRETYVTMDDGVKLYTRIIIPEEGKKLPIVFIRTPYDPARNGKKCSPEEFKDNQFIKNGYAIVAQHVRGAGDSDGVFSPYCKRERDDGLLTLEFIRTLDIYNGEIYLAGSSYLTQVHYLYLNTCPKDIKGAVLPIQTDDMYHRNFRNGSCYNFANLPWWEMACKRQFPHITSRGVIYRPYKDIPKRMTGGEDIPILTDMLTHHKDDEFWASIPMKDAPETLDFPVLYMEGWHDYYCDGMFTAWQKLKETTREKSAMLVYPAGHCARPDGNAEYSMPNCMPPEDAAVQWFNSIRSGEKYPYAEYGKITYYNIGKDTWETAGYPPECEYMRLYLNADRTLGEKGKEGSIVYEYDPEKRHNFFKYNNILKHGKADEKMGIISFYSEEFKEEQSFFGKVKWHMPVISNCEDTQFFMRVYLVEDKISYNMCETLTTLCHMDENYKPDTEIMLDLETMPIAFTVKKGCALRVDISSDSTIYNAHANVKGHWAYVNETKVAKNTILCQNAYIELPQA